MNYSEMRKMYSDAVKASPATRQNPETLILHREIDMKLSYPGFKDNDSGLPDFRVSLNGFAVAHEDIAKDIWEKLEGGLDPDVLRGLLFDLAQNGIISNTNDYIVIDNYPGYTLAELVHTISWIALQEDINYPIGRYQGRKMPFYRYIEAVFAYTNPEELTKREVIDRINVTGRPPQPYGFIDYGIIYSLR